MSILPSRENQKLILAFATGTFVGMFASWMWVATQDQLSPETMADQHKDQPKVSEVSEEPLTNSFSDSQIHNGAIVVPDQGAGLSVIISKATLPEDGWVVIHEGTESQIGNALGAARFDAGEHGGTVELLRETEPNTLYRAVLYRDNGDREFNLDEDFPFLGGAGQPVLSTFTVK